MIESELPVEIESLVTQLREAFFSGHNGQVYRCILDYDKLVAERTGDRLVRRQVPRMLCKTAIWKHIDRMVRVCEALAADSTLYLRAQFAAFPHPARPYPPMLYSEASVARWNNWQSKKVNLYKGNAAAAAETEAVSADPKLAIQAALDVGYKLWKKMGRPNVALVAETISNMLPALFLLSFPPVETQVRKGLLMADTLQATLSELDACPGGWQLVHSWHATMDSVLV